MDINRNKNFNKKRSVLSILIAISFLLGGLTIFVPPPVEAMSDGHFDMFTGESTKYVANVASVARRTASFDIQIRNFDSANDIIEFDYEWNYLGGDPGDWDVTFSFNPLPVDGLDGTGPGRATTTISITAPSDSTWEDKVVPLILTGTSTLISPFPQNTIWLTTIMNSYEANITHDNMDYGTKQIEHGDPYQFIVPEGSVDYLMRVTNLGKVKSSIDLIPNNVPAFWNVVFINSLTGNPLIDTNGDDPNHYVDTGQLNPNGVAGDYLNIIMQVTSNTASSKYNQIEIEIESDPFEDGSRILENNGFVFTTTTEMRLINTISDEDPASPHFYYKDKFRGHNVNPGMPTTYDLSIFRMDSMQGDVTLAFTGNSMWDPTFLDAAGVPLLTNTISSPATVGDFVRIYLKVTAPVDATKGTEEVFTVNADLDGSPPPEDSIAVKAKVTLDKKVYILNLDSINQEYLNLDNTGNDYYPSDTRLMPNVWEVINTGSMYKGVTDNLPAVTDNNHVGIIASAPAGMTGIPAVGAYYTGWNDDTNLPLAAYLTPDVLRVETIYDSIDKANSDLRTGVTVGKNWVARVFNGPSCDIMSHGEVHPYYVREAGLARLGDPGGDTDIPSDDNLAGNADYFRNSGGTDSATDSVSAPPNFIRHFPTDKWVKDSALSMIEHEDPDFLYILFANGDDAGHVYGSIEDPDFNPTDINSLANPEDLLDTIVETDRQVGNFIQYLKDRGTYEESIIVITSDHNMKTVKENEHIDIKDFLMNIPEPDNYIMGEDYNYIFSEGPFIQIHGIKQDPPGDMTILNGIKTAIVNEYPDQVWMVLTMDEQRDDSNLYNNMPYGLFNQYYADHNFNGPSHDTETIKQPELYIFTEFDPTTGGLYDNMIYSDVADAGMNALNLQLDLPYIPRDLAVGIVIGNHGTWSEQHVPLIFHGSMIEQGYENIELISEGITIMDIIPTICEINGWINPSWPGDGYFEDHEAQGDVLWDCLISRPVHNEDKDIWYINIQDAIDDADPDDTIKVYSGNYNEHLTIDKRLNLIGETRGVPDINGYGYSGQTSIIDGGGTGTVITITADNVYIEGFEVRGGVIGIHVSQTDSVTISYNTISNHIDKGLFIDYATNTYMSHNRIINNPNIGSHAYYSVGKGFHYNEIAWNNVALKFEQSSLFYCDNENWYHDNSVGFDFDPIIELPPLLIDSNVFEDNTIAIKITGGSEITLSNNNILNNDYGILLYNSNEISIIDNDIYDNTNDGIYIDSASHDNVIYHNNLQDSSNIYDYGANNQWDNGLEGNWWSGNPNPIDTDGNGICDVPYLGTTFTDRYPLANEDNDRVHVGTVSQWFIQSAINLADENDVIYIDIGAYLESVTVGKSLTAIGDMTILHGDLTIPTGTVLTLQDSDLLMAGSYDGELTITVDGTLHLINSNIYSIDPQFRYNIIGQGNIIIENSDIRNVHPGSIFGFSENLIYYGSPSIPYTSLVLQFPPGGNAQLAYLKLPKTTDILYAQFDLTGAPIGPNYPTYPSIDVGNDDFIEWSYPNQLTTTETVTDLNTNPIFAISVQDYIDMNQPDENGFINIPVLFSSQSEGELIISNIDLGYTDKWASAIFSEDPISSSCYLDKFTVDIYYTGLGGIRIDNSLCPEIDYINTIGEENWQRPATIKHYYFDVDNNGIVDGTSMAESTLQMQWWDEFAYGWIPTSTVFGEENTGVNSIDNYVWTNVDHFSNFTTKGSYVPIEETEELIVTTINMEIHEGIKNSLITKLDVTLSYLNAAQEHFINGELDLGNENLALAKDKLNDFINEVEAQRGKAIREQDADILINDAQIIIDLIDEAIV